MSEQLPTPPEEEPTHVPQHLAYTPDAEDEAVLEPEPAPEPVTEAPPAPSNPDLCPECAAAGNTRRSSSTVRRGSHVLNRCRAGHTW